MRFFFSYVRVAVLSAFCTGVWASTISVVNPSFEILPSNGLPLACPVEPGCYFSTDNITGWSSSDTTTSGQLQPGTQLGNDTYFSSIPDGNTIAYSRGGTISQTVIPTVQLGVTYTLMVDLGFNDAPNFAFDGSADLLINGIRYYATGTAPSPGNWSTYTATYTGLTSDVGQSITIELQANGRQGDFDNVRLSSTVPEPGIFGLVGVSLIFLGMRRRQIR